MRGEQILLGMECNAATDKLKAMYTFAASGTTYEYSGNLSNQSNTAGFVTGLTAIPTTFPNNGYFLHFGLKMASPAYIAAATNNAATIASLTYLDPTNYTYTPLTFNTASVINSGSVKRKAVWQVLYGVTTKNINTIRVPLVQDFIDGTKFTDAVTIKVIHNTNIYTTVVTLAQLAPYNLLTITSPITSFDYDFILPTPFLLLAGEALYVGLECNAASDLFNFPYTYNTASATAEYTGNFTNNSNTANSVIGLTAMPAVPAANSYYVRMNLGYSVTVPGTQNLTINPPKKIYTVVNDIVPANKGYARNYSAALYLDHLFNGITYEMDIKFDESMNDRVLFNSDVHVIDSNEFNPTITYNTDGSTVKKILRNLNIIGSAIKPQTFQVTQVSTLASATKSIKPRILCIGDSITYGEQAKFTQSGAYQSYSLLTKQLFEQDKLDNGYISGQYEALLLGSQQRTLTFNYAPSGSTATSAYTITACHEGRRGWTTDMYASSGTTGNPFWDTGSTRFSLNPWLNQYRTMDDTGTRLPATATTKGYSVTDVTLWDVCLPTHVVLMLGINDTETAASWVQKIQGMIANIKLDVTTYGWANIKIFVGLFDSAGTVFSFQTPAVR